jgi:hypothetical protein
MRLKSECYDTSSNCEVAPKSSLTSALRLNIAVLLKLLPPSVTVRAASSVV